jgi:hypothetical protein
MQPTEPQSTITPDQSTGAGLPPASPMQTPPVVGSSAMVAPPRKSRKKLLIITGAVLGVLLIGGTASAMWWTSPQKAFDDATSLNQALPKGGTVKGSIVVTPAGSPEVTFDFDTKYATNKMNTDLALKVNAGAVNLNLTGGVAYEADKSMFFKVNDVRKTITTFAGSSSGAIDQYYGGLIDKIDGKWVEMTSSDLKDLTKDSGADLSCATSTFTKLTTDQSYLKELSAMYDKNKYISIKDVVGSEKIDGRDSMHYTLAFDETKMKAYESAVKSSKFMQDFKKCVTNESSESTSLESSPAPQGFEIWVDKWSHKITKVMLTSDSEGTAVKMTAVFGYNDAQAVTIPKADTQFKDLKSEVESLQEMFAPASSTEEFSLDSI